MLPTRLGPALFLLALLAAPAQSQEPPRVLVVAVEDQIIHPVTQRFLARAIRQAADRGDPCVIIQLDTPGGLMESTRHIVKDILTSEVPIVVYVAPSGGRAKSAGVFIVLSAHVAAMAPGTNIGAAQPMPVGRGVLPAALGDRNLDPVEMVLEEHVANDAEAWARALAEYRRRNIDWAVRAVKDGISTPATDALREGVIDLVAVDQADLLKRLDGRQVSLIGRAVTLRTKDAVVERMEMSWSERALSLLANPTLAYLLLLLGFAGVVFEITHPGTWIPGVFGLTCLVLAFFAMQMLPINYAGLALLVLGLLLVGLEVKFHSYGLWTAAGIVCLLIGSAMLIEPVAGVERVSWLVVAPVTIALALIMLVLVSNVVRAHRGKVQTGIERLLGAHAQVKGSMDGEGFVFVSGELWRAQCDLPLQDGETVRVEAYDGLTLHVRPLSDNVAK
jgi:membrane-bound serine protease (ClpP class)